MKKPYFYFLGPKPSQVSPEEERLLAQRRKARRLIRNFSIIDPTLWPILSEIDLALTDKEERE